MLFTVGSVQAKMNLQAHNFGELEFTLFNDFRMIESSGKLKRCVQSALRLPFTTSDVTGN